jgi:hypothetical protein
MAHDHVKILGVGSMNSVEHTLIINQSDYLLPKPKPNP